MKYLITFLLIFPGYSFACSCAGYDEESVYSESHNVFIGRLTSFGKRIGNSLTGYLQPIKIYKGNIGDNSPIHVSGGGCTHIGYIELGSVYLVYSKKGEGAQIGMCSPTRIIDNDDLEYTKSMLLEFNQKANKALKSDAERAGS